MAPDGPQIHFVRAGESTNRVNEALELARRLEELLEETHSVSPPSREGSAASAPSTRMARAMAAGLVDELEALVRGARKKTSAG